MKQINVYKGRVTRVSVSLPYDVSEEMITGQIRKELDDESEVIKTWEVTHLTDGTDGEIVLTVDDSDRSITQSMGYTDLKRVSAGKPLTVFNEPFEVLFKETVTE